MFLLLVLLLFLSCLRGYRNAISERGSDLTIYLDAAQAVTEGRSPMGVLDYIYLPCMAVMIAPLGWLPMALSALLWQLASFAAILWIVFTLASLLDPERKRPWLRLVLIAIPYRLIQSNLGYGQANAFTLAAILLCVRLCLQGRDQRAGLVLGVAAAFKVLPGFLLILFLIRGRTKLCALAGSLWFALAWLAPALALGWHGGVQANLDWFHQVVQPYLLGGHALLESRPFLPGQSIVAAIYHLLVDTPISSNAPDLRANFVNWNPDSVHWIVRALTATHLLLFLWVSLRIRCNKQTYTLLTNLALALCTAVLVTPIAHKAHMIWTLPGIGVLLVGYFRDRSTLAIFCLVPFTLLVGFTTSAIVGSDAARWLTGHGVIWLAVEILWVGLLGTAFALGPGPKHVP